MSAEKNEADPNDQAPEGQTSLKVINSVREGVQNIDKSSKTIPETTKPLRLTFQSHLQGELTYSAESLPGGDVVVKIKITLPLPFSPTDTEEMAEHPKEEHMCTIQLNPEQLDSLESLKTHLSKEISDFVFSNFSKNNALGEGDSGRIDKMAEDIFEIFCK